LVYLPLFLLLSPFFLFDPYFSLRLTFRAEAGTKESGEEKISSFFLFPLLPLFFFSAYRPFAIVERAVDREVKKTTKDDWVLRFRRCSTFFFFPSFHCGQLDPFLVLFIARRTSGAM